MKIRKIGIKKASKTEIQAIRTGQLFQRTFKKAF